MGILRSVANRMNEVVRNLSTGGLAILGVYGAVGVARDGSFWPAVGALLAVSSVGWLRILRRRVGDELLERRVRILRFQYGWGTLVQAVPPWIFGVSAYAYAEAGFGMIAAWFTVAAVVTAVPPPAFALRFVQLHAIAGSEEEAEVVGRPDIGGVLKADIG